MRFRMYSAWGFTYNLPKVVKFAEDLFFFDVATGMTAKRCLAHATGETTHMPAQVVNLNEKT